MGTTDGRRLTREDALKAIAEKGGDDHQNSIPSAQELKSQEVHTMTETTRIETSSTVEIEIAAKGNTRSAFSTSSAAFKEAAGYLREAVGDEYTANLFNATRENPLVYVIEHPDMTYETRLFTSNKGTATVVDFIPTEAINPILRVAKAADINASYKNSWSQAMALMQAILAVRRGSWHVATAEEMRQYGYRRWDAIAQIEHHARNIPVSEIRALGGGRVPVVFRANPEWDAEKGYEVKNWNPMAVGSTNGLVSLGDHGGLYNRARAMHSFIHEIHRFGVGVRVVVPTFVSVEENRTVRNNQNKGNPFFFLSRVLIPSLEMGVEEATEQYYLMVDEARMFERIEAVAKSNAQKAQNGNLETEKAFGGEGEFPNGVYTVVVVPGAPARQFTLDKNTASWLLGRLVTMKARGLPMHYNGKPFANVEGASVEAEVEDVEVDESDF